MENASAIQEHLPAGRTVLPVRAADRGRFLPSKAESLDREYVCRCAVRAGQIKGRSAEESSRPSQGRRVDEVSVEDHAPCDERTFARLPIYIVKVLLKNSAVQLDTASSLRGGSREHHQRPCLLDGPGGVRSGSFATLACFRDVRSCPDSNRRADVPKWSKSARSGLLHP